ncbi:hypothetical protein STENM223S_04052 [Streptomyces tendae]
MTALPLEALVDPVCGIVRDVKPVDHPVGAPPRYTALTAEIADARLLGLWPADRVSLGTTFGDPESARTAAIAEGIERYCGNRVPPPGHPDAPRAPRPPNWPRRGCGCTGRANCRPTQTGSTPGKFPYCPHTA